MLRSKTIYGIRRKSVRTCVGGNIITAQRKLVFRLSKKKRNMLIGCSASDCDCDWNEHLNRKTNDILNPTVCLIISVCLNNSISVCLNNSISVCLNNSIIAVCTYMIYIASLYAMIYI